MVRSHAREEQSNAHRSERHSLKLALQTLETSQLPYRGFAKHSCSKRLNFPYKQITISFRLLTTTNSIHSHLQVKVKVPVTDLKVQRWGRGIALLFLDLGIRRGWMVSITPRPLYPRERPGTHCTGGWMGPRAGLDGCGKSRPHRHSIPGPSSQSLYQTLSSTGFRLIFETEDMPLFFLTVDN
jgi:hypothetical protein